MLLTLRSAQAISLENSFFWEVVQDIERTESYICVNQKLHLTSFYNMSNLILQHVHSTSEIEIFFSWKIILPIGL